MCCAPPAGRGRALLAVLARSDHRWKGLRKAHPEFDVLVIYRIQSDELHLVRTGTHSGPFGE
ncbi:MAG: hypothetical protein F4X77_05285 [Acidobacteriia bacterium]|nr:hypothetical protein [Terriglobia bacterium]